MIQKNTLLLLMDCLLCQR